MLPTNLIRTAAFRMTFGYAGAFLAVVLLLMLIAYVGSTQLVQARLFAALDQERTELEAAFASGGIEGIAAKIDARQAETEQTAYLLQSPDGEVIAGNLPAMAPIVGRTSIIPPDNDVDEPFLAEGTRLADGHFLLVAEDAEAVHDMREIAVVGSLWILGITLPLGLIGGFVISSMTLRRIQTISATTNRIKNGNLKERVPLTGRDDEFDQLAGSINGMLDSIQDLNQALRQTANDIAHDLRTPLTRLRQGLEAARRRATTAAAFTEAIDDALEQTDGILQIFGALLRIGQIESGSRREHFIELDLSALVSCLSETYDSVAADSGKQLRFAIADGATFVGDRELLVQMFANLIENAIEHTPDGSEVAIRLSVDRGRITVEIGDNGPGILAYERANVFRRFYRLDASRGTPGSGLGLSIVAAIAALHRIDIELIDNKPGLLVRLAFPMPTETRTKKAGNGGVSF